LDVGPNGSAKNRLHTKFRCKINDCSLAGADLARPLRWFGPPHYLDLQAAWVLGDERTAGPYLLRVRLASGGRIPPHTHPDTCPHRQPGGGCRSTESL